MFVPSAMVTSWTRMALSLQGADPPALVGGTVGEGVIGRGKDVLVGGSVAVTKRGVGLAGVGVEMETLQEASSNVNRLRVEKRVRMFDF
jgi:hypothetical protein